jgi:hypothetical protein
MKNKLYKCKICRLMYKKRKWAKRCKKWCAKYGTWNLKITKHAFCK